MKIHFSFSFCSCIVILCLVLASCSVSTSQVTVIPDDTMSPTETLTQTASPDPTASITLTPPPLPTGNLLLYGHVQNLGSVPALANLDDGTRKILFEDFVMVMDIAWTPDGARIVFTGTPSKQEGMGVYIMNWDGTSRTLIYKDDTHTPSFPVVSPDGRKIALFLISSGSSRVFVMDLDGSNLHPVTSDFSDPGEIRWSPDGVSVVFTFSKTEDAIPQIARINVNGEEYLELTNGEHVVSSPNWSPDGSRILFASEVAGIPQVCVMDADGSDQKCITQTVGGNYSPVWSPDGEQIAFVSWRDSKAPVTCLEEMICNNEIYVMDSDGSNQTRLTYNSSSDYSPAWSPDGSTIAFVSLRDETLDPVDCELYCDSEIYVMDANGENLMRVTYDPAPDFEPLWRPVNPE